MCRALEICLALVCVMTQADCCQRAAAQVTSSSFTRLNLKDYGWQSLPKAHEWVGTSSRLVSIDKEGRLLVGFTTRENLSLATREHPGLSLHILRFTSEGKLDVSLILPTNNWFNNGLYVGADDRVFARANNAFQFLSEQHGAGDAVWVWKTLAPCSMECTIIQSPSRLTFIVRDSQEGRKQSYIVRDTSAAAPPTVNICPWIDSYGQAITDRFVYHSTDGIRTDALRWPLCEQGHKTELPLSMRNGAIRPLSDDALLLLGTPIGNKGPLRGVDLLGPGGQVKFHQEMPTHDIVVPIWTALDETGDHFAFTVETWRGGSRPLDISGKRVARRVVVYDIDGHELASVPVSSTYHRDFDFALSPDGHRLAVLDEGIVITLEIR